MKGEKATQAANVEELREKLYLTLRTSLDSQDLNRVENEGVDRLQHYVQQKQRKKN